MLRPLLAIAFVLLLAPEAAAQVAATPAGAAAAAEQAEIAAQAGLDTSELLAAYMAQLAAAGNPPSQADIDEAVRQYFTNGAAATGVPTSGPAAEYFRNGAAVTGVPTSGPMAAYFQNGAEVTAYRATPTEQAPPPAPPAPSSSAAPAAAPAIPAAAATATPPATGQPAATPAPAVPATMQNPRSSEDDRMPPASFIPSSSTEMQPESMLAAPPSTAPVSHASPAPSAPTTTRAGDEEVAVEHSVKSAADVLKWARLFPALGGALLVGIAIALWSRGRAPRGRTREAS